MTAAHTPGPWVVSPYGDGFEVESAAGICIAQTQQLRPIKKKEDHDERKSNACLIAAAPDLLEALKELRGWYQEHSGLPACAANAAISKATGAKP